MVVTMDKAKKTALSLLAVGAIFFSTINTHSYAASKVTEGEFVKTESIDDATGLPTSGLPVYKDSFSSTPGTVQPNLAAGNLIYKDAGYYGSSYVVEQSMSEGESLGSKIFVKYLTSSWAKASSYTWSTSVATTWQLAANATVKIAERVASQLGLSVSRTTTYSVAVTVPADSTKFSKLGFASDFFTQYYYYTKTVDGTQVASEHAYERTPTKDTYLIVYYQ